MCGIRRTERNWQNRGDWITDDVARGNVHFLAPSGGKAACPPYGGIQSHPLCGWILYFLFLVAPARPDRWGLEVSPMTKSPPHNRSGGGYARRTSEKEIPRRVGGGTKN